MIVDSLFGEERREWKRKRKETKQNENDKENAWDSSNVNNSRPKIAKTKLGGREMAHENLSDIIEPDDNW